VKFGNKAGRQSSASGMVCMVYMAGSEWGLGRPGDFIASEAFQLAVKTDYAGVSGNFLWIT
jgi:hypothetical protein